MLTRICNNLLATNIIALRKSATSMRILLSRLCKITVEKPHQEENNLLATNIIALRKSATSMRFAPSTLCKTTVEKQNQEENNIFERALLLSIVYGTPKQLWTALSISLAAGHKINWDEEFKCSKSQESITLLDAIKATLTTQTDDIDAYLKRIFLNIYLQQKEDLRQQKTSCPSR